MTNRGEWIFHCFRHAANPGHTSHSESEKSAPKMCNMTLPPSFCVSDRILQDRNLESFSERILEERLLEFLSKRTCQERIPEFLSEWTFQECNFEPLSLQQQLQIHRRLPWKCLFPMTFFSRRLQTLKDVLQIVPYPCSLQQPSQKLL